MSAKSLSRRFLKSRAACLVISQLIASYIRFVYFTSRKRIEIDEVSRLYLLGKMPAVFAFWHSRLMMMTMICPHPRKMHALISTHRDGEILAYTMRCFGLGTIRGSSSREGVSGAMNTIKALQAGDNVSITPDGPRGPAMKLQPGLLNIAELAGVPIIPAAYGASRNKRLRSWDRFMIALPFGTLHYKVGAPIYNGTHEGLEKRLLELTEEVDRL